MQKEPTAAEVKEVTPFQMLIVLLSVYVLAVLFYQSIVQVPEHLERILDTIDDAICVIFLIDFGIRFTRAPSKLKFMKWGWIDLLSSIPTIDALRWGRLVRVIRLFRILRAFRSSKALITFILRKRAQSTFVTVSLLSITLTIFASIAILNLERDPAANIKTPTDAVWWAFVTITTVGYGDKYPVTPEGRLLAAFLMTAGVGLFGTFTGLVASLFMEPDQRRENEELTRLVTEVQALRDEVATLTRHLSGTPPPEPPTLTPK